MSYEAADKALQKAKIALMTKPDTTFFITVCFSLKHRFDENVPTACTNGKEIRYNPDFFLKLSEAERLFLLLHETMHVVFLHVTRLNGRNARKWNIAGDYVINYMLTQRGYIMPDGGLLNPKYGNMSTEDVYNQLDDDEENQDFNQDIEEAEGDISELQDELDDILVRASVQSQMANDKPGSIPGEIELYLKSLLDPVLPWDKILRRYMNQNIKNEYSFTRPNRRFLPDVYLPTQYSNSLDNIAIAIDTSGSVSDEQFHQFMSETYNICKSLRPKELTLIQFDWLIRAEDKITSPSDFAKVKFTGRGGTLIDPVIEWAGENRPKLLIIFTDGYFYDCPLDPKLPIIWLIHSQENYQAPYGRVIDYPLNC